MYICMNIHMYIVALIHLKPVVSAHKAKRIAKRAFFPPPTNHTHALCQSNRPRTTLFPTNIPFTQCWRRIHQFLCCPRSTFLSISFCCVLCASFSVSPPTLFDQALIKCKPKPVSHTRTQRGCACVRWFNDSTPFPIVLSIKKSKKKMKKKQKMLPGSNNKMPYTWDNAAVLDSFFYYCSLCLRCICCCCCSFPHCCIFY